MLYQLSYTHHRNRTLTKLSHKSKITQRPTPQKSSADPLVARQKGFEPLTRGLEGRCSSPSELLARWSGRLDSNQRPPAPKAGALPGCATPRHFNSTNFAARNLQNRVTAMRHRFDALRLSIENRSERATLTAIRKVRKPFEEYVSRTSATRSPQPHRCGRKLTARIDSPRCLSRASS